MIDGPRPSQVSRGRMYAGRFVLVLWLDDLEDGRRDNIVEDIAHSESGTSDMFR